MPALVACTDQERPRRLLPAMQTDSSIGSPEGSGGRDAGNDFSEDGSAGDDAAREVSAADGNTGEGDGSGMGGSGGGALTWTCNGNYAYWATSLDHFETPTPPLLAHALTAISKRVPALSLVLHLHNGALLGALFATIPGPAGKDVFPPNRNPSFSPTVLAFGTPPGVTTVDAQPHAFLRFVDDNGPVEIQIEHLVWRATEGRDCNDVSVRVQAVVPSSQFSVVLRVAGNYRTVGQLVDTFDSGGVTPNDDSGPPNIPVELAFVFQAVPMAFDFSEGCCSP